MAHKGQNKDDDKQNSGGQKATHGTPDSGAVATDPMEIETGCAPNPEILRQQGRLMELLPEYQIGQRPAYLQLRAGRKDVDKTVEMALRRVEQHDAFQDADEFRRLVSHGLATPLNNVTRKLNQMGLEDLSRQLLVRPGMYEHVLLATMKKEVKDLGNFELVKEAVSDTIGFTNAVLRTLNQNQPPELRAVFIRQFVNAVIQSRHLDLQPDSLRYFRLINRMQATALRVGPGQAVKDMLVLVDQINGEGILPALIEAYIDRKELDERNFDAHTKNAMIDYLIKLGVNLASPSVLPRVEAGEFDEYFALAYHHASQTSSGNADPIDSTRARGSITPWDFTVDTFEDIEEQGIVKENILAAGAIDYIYELGERMGIFRLLDALVLNWSSGAIDVVDGEAANKLYRYWKLREERTSPEERAMVYKRVLNKGQSQVLDRMVVNEHFGRCWSQLMEEIVEYIGKVEDVEVGKNQVSRMPLYQAVKEVQYNLTEFSNGMAHLQASEMYAQLQEAIDILRDPEVVDHFGGSRRKTMWTVIARLSHAEFDASPNISAIRSAAVEGNKIFQFIAEFDQGTVTDEFFQSHLIDAGEAYILAKGVDAGEEVMDEFSEDEEDGFDDFDDFGDENDFGDFDE